VFAVRTGGSDAVDPPLGRAAFLTPFADIEHVCGPHPLPSLLRIRLRAGGLLVSDTAAITVRVVDRSRRPIRPTRPPSLAGGRWDMLSSGHDAAHVWQTDNVMHLTEGAVVAPAGQHGLTPCVGDSPHSNTGGLLRSTSSRKVAVNTLLCTAHAAGRCASSPHSPVSLSRIAAADRTLA